MWRILVTPLVGMVIGYITNDLAIRMLFRPYREIYLGRWHVPFTPGLIPSQQGRIAKALGGVVGNQLLNAETLKKEALSEPVLQKLRGGIETGLRGVFASQTTARAWIMGYVAEDAVQASVQKLRDAASDYLMTHIREAGLGERVAQQVLLAMREKTKKLPLTDKLNEALSGSLAPRIAGMVEQMIDQQGPEILQKQLDNLEESLLDQPVDQLLSNYESHIPILTDKLLAAYQAVLESKLEDMLSKVGIDQIVERKIASFDPKQLETLTFGVMKRELRAIVYLGAALGFLMGFVNLLF